MLPRVITVAQQKGGAGKTTVAVHLSIALMQRGFRLALIDIDPQGSLSRWHQIREQHFGEGYSGVTFSSLSGWRVGSEISRLRRSHNLIIIDSPPHVETEARTAIRNADFVLVPVQPSPTDIWATQATVELAKSENIPVRTVLNRVNAQSKLADAIRKELPDQTRNYLGNRVMFASALFEGRGVTEVAPSSQASVEIKALAEEVLSMLDMEDEKDVVEGEETFMFERALEPA